MAAPDDLYQTLAALKDAGASYARFHPDGQLAEIQFTPERSEAEPAAPQMVELPAPAAEAPPMVVNGIPMRHPGYAALFKDDATRPRFRPAE